MTEKLESAVLDAQGFLRVRHVTASPRSYRRETFSPGDDLSALPKAARAKAEKLWTPAFVKAWREEQAPGGVSSGLSGAP